MSSLMLLAAALATCLQPALASTPNETPRGAAFGVSVALIPETIFIAAAPMKEGKPRAASVHVFERRQARWIRSAVLPVPEATVEDSFGISMAADGDTLVVGAQFADARGHDAGLAYVFERRDQEWRQAAVLSASDAAADDQFGLTVSVRGTTIVVGARLQDSGGMDAGAAYVFAHDDAGWRQTAKLRASDAAPGDLFGRASVEMNTMVISADLNDDRGSNGGKAYAFERREGKWVEAAILRAEDAAEGDEFGVTLALTGDTAVFGAASGAAYVFERRAGRWTQSARLSARDGARSQRFGWAVAAGADTIVIGAPNDGSKGEAAGAAYLYERSGGGWAETAKLTASDAAAACRFGSSVAISDGTIVVGMRLDGDGPRRGAAYVFERLGGRWSEVARLDDAPMP